MIKIIIQITTILAITTCIIGCNTKSKKEESTENVESATLVRPTDSELHAYKAYHHTRYLVETAKSAGGTNKLIHTKKLPTEGTDAVVTPALDHLYSKAVIDLTNGPVTVDIPEGANDRYWSIHITDQEHYTIFDEVRPVGKYTFVRKGNEFEVPKDATIIECPGDYPHLFIRIQVKTEDDIENTHAKQETITLTGQSNSLEVDNFIDFTLKTHDVYKENQGLLETVRDFNDTDYARVSEFLTTTTYINTNLGLFGPIDSKEPNSNNPVYRAAAIFGHLGLPAEHAIYFPNFVNCDGVMLNGSKKEVFTFPYTPKNVKEFWSITRYSGLTRNTIKGQNDVFNAYNTKSDENGNITITFSADDPKDKTYWMAVNKEEPYYFIVRYYKADINDLPETHCK